MNECSRKPDCMPDGVDFSKPFYSPSAAPYAAPGDPYQYDMLWMVDTLRHLLKCAEALRCKDNAQDGHLQELDCLTQAIRKKVCEIDRKLDNGCFMKDDFLKWADNNMPDIIQRMTEFVFFGLTDDGHFVAYVPESWNFLKFDTILKCCSPCYGRLIINY